MSKDSKTKWYELAACKNMDTNIFFPDIGDNSYNPLAIATCSDCPVKDPCLQDALTRDEKGYWGGTTQADRVRLRKTIPSAEGLAPCGTVAAHSRHLRRKEECDTCRRAYNDHKRERMRANRQSVGTRALRG